MGETSKKVDNMKKQPAFTIGGCLLATALLLGAVSCTPDASGPSGDTTDKPVTDSAPAETSDAADTGKTEESHGQTEGTTEEQTPAVSETATPDTEPATGSGSETDPEPETETEEETPPPASAIETDENGALILPPVYFD